MLGAYFEGWRVLEEWSHNQAGLDHSEPLYACARLVGPLKEADAPEEQSLSIGVDSGTVPCAACLSGHQQMAPDRQNQPLTQAQSYSHSHSLTVTTTSPNSQ